MNKEFSLVVAKNLVDSSEQFPVDFDLAWQWLGYSTKSDAKVSFKSCGFIETFDFISFQDKSVKPLGGRPTEIIMLSIDAFKCWAMMSRTDTGKKIRQYFLECERIAKITEPPKLNIYARRVQIASKWDIPKGYWCVFHEISLLANSVGELYQVNNYDLIVKTLMQSPFII